MESSAQQSINFLSSIKANKEKKSKLTHVWKMVGRATTSVYEEVNSRLMPVFCSEVSLVGNLMLNLILKFPLLEGSLGIGIPSPLTTSS